MVFLQDELCTKPEQACTFQKGIANRLRNEFMEDDVFYSQGTKQKIHLKLVFISSAWMEICKSERKRASGWKNHAQNNSVLLIDGDFWTFRNRKQE